MLVDFDMNPVHIQKIHKDLTVISYDMLLERKRPAMIAQDENWMMRTDPSDSFLLLPGFLISFLHGFMSSIVIGTSPVTLPAVTLKASRKTGPR